MQAKFFLQVMSGIHSEGSFKSFGVFPLWKDVFDKLILAENVLLDDKLDSYTSDYPWCYPRTYFTNIQRERSKREANPPVACNRGCRPVSTALTRSSFGSRKSRAAFCSNTPARPNLYTALPAAPTREARTSRQRRMDTDGIVEVVVEFFSICLPRSRRKRREMRRRRDVAGGNETRWGRWLFSAAAS